MASQESLMGYNSSFKLDGLDLKGATSLSRVAGSDIPQFTKRLKENF